MPWKKTAGRKIAGWVGIVLLAWARAAFGQLNEGSPVAGRVIEAEGKGGIAGAHVVVEGREATTDEQGAFRFTFLPTGAHMLTVSAAGHQTAQIAVTVGAEPVTLPPVELGRGAVQMEKVVVAGEKAGAEASFRDKAASDALAEVVSGAALKSATAQSANDLLKNVSGVGVSRGGDGTSSVTVRGMDSRFVRVTVDGQRQGSATALDSIPPEIIQSLEVSKVLTPDQDADAIGGAINVTTGTANLKDAYTQGRHQLTYNTLEPRLGTRNSFTVARPLHLFSNSSDVANAGFLLTAGFDDQYRHREGIRVLREYPALISPGPAPFKGQLVPVLTQPRIDTTLEHRQRSSLVFNADARFGPTAILWRSNFTRDWTKRDRQLDDFDPDLGTPVELAPYNGVISGVTLNRRDQRQVVQRDAANFVLGARTTLGRAEIDATLGAALADEKEPHTVETVFRSDHTFRTSYDLRLGFLPRFAFVDETNPNDPSSLRDPARFSFDNLTDSRGDTRDRELAGRLSVKVNLDEQANAYVKFGGKLQQRRRTVDVDRRIYDSGPAARSMSGLVGSPLVSLHTMGYEIGPIPDASAVAALLPTAPAVFRLNAVNTLVNSSTGDYEVTETIAAAYAMARIKRDRWTILGGVRLEDTRVDSDANALTIGPAGDVQSVRPVEAEREYLLLLPGLHLRFDAQPGLLFRASATRALNRPNYVELSPSQQINFIDRRSRVGNPDLKPYDATNFDLSVDRYNERTGLLSLGVFRKQIKHVIQDAQYPITIGDLGQFIEFKRINADDARVWGVETSWQSIKLALPANLGTGSTALNYTFLHSDTRIPSRPGETFTLKAQPQHLVNLVMSVERNRLSMDGTVRYRSKTLEDIIDPGFDNYRLGAFDAELSLAYKINKDARATFGVTNLLNRPVREYSGTSARMNQFEKAGVDFVLGLQWKLPTGSAKKNGGS